MKKKIVHVLVLAFAVLAVVLIHNRVRYEAEEAEKLAVETAAQPSELSVEAEEPLPTIRLGGDVVRGLMSENEELGGVNIVLAEDDGSGTVCTFTDVAVDAWYADAVNYVVSAGLMSGVGDKQVFRPDYGVLRETFVSILYRFADGETGGAKRSFDDVPEESEYYDAVVWAADSAVLKPVSAETFGVGEFVTCEQALVSLYRLAGRPETDGSLAGYPYAAKVSESGRNAVDWAWKNGLIEEDKENGCIWYPTQAISRAQVALLLLRTSEKFS